MSAILLEDSLRPLPPAVRERGERRQPEAPKAPARARREAAQRHPRAAKSIAWPKALVLYLAAGFLTYWGSSIAGHGLTLEARREGMRATERAREAKAAVALLRERVGRLSSVESLDSWAALRGFVLPEAASVAPQEGVRVASLR
jgi:hypothetical protein